MRLTAVLLTGLLLSAFAPRAQAGLITTGRVEYDAATHLFTYSYTLDNTTGPWLVTELSVLVAPNRADFDLRPPAWTAPSGWAFVTAVSGGIANGPYTEVGTFWQWYKADGLPVGERAEFTFASSYGPGGVGNNYFVFAPEATRGGQDGIIEYGRTVAPVVAPEPATATICGVGLGLFGFLVGAARRFGRG